MLTITKPEIEPDHRVVVVSIATWFIDVCTRNELSLVTVFACSKALRYTVQFFIVTTC